MTTHGSAAVSNGHKPGHSSPDAGVENDIHRETEVRDTEPDPESDGPGAADEDTATPEADGVEGAAALQPKAHRRRWLTRGVTAVLIAAALAGVGYGGWLGYRQHQLTVAARDAQHAAEKYAAVLTSIDTNAIDQNFTDVLNGSTGEFKDMYSKSSTQLRQLLLDNKAAAHGTVLESAVQSVTTDRVVVLLFVDQSITNAQVPDPRIDRSRIKMTMEKVDGHWLAGKVELP